MTHPWMLPTVVLAVLLPGVLCGVEQEPPVTDQQREHWAFQRLDDGVVPKADAIGLVNPVDAFVHAKLRAAGLGFSPEAEKATLLRRVTMDLTGLPPSPAEVIAFLGDDSPDAYEREVDRLLASPRYGERWAQHWLDAARFAESDGFEFDHERPNAWRYRDWVIDSLNADTSFANFVRAQIAGDEVLTNDIEATGFLMAGPDMVDINLADERRHNFLNDMTSTVGEVFLGLSIGCAQCHDHRSDPISIHDFYRLRAFFDNTIIDPKKSKQLPSTVREESAMVSESFVRVRGDFRRRGDPVSPTFPRVLDPAGKVVPAPAPGATSSMRRAALAEWLVGSENALVFRVMANRLWLHHFGRGIVGTPNDFGKLGHRPSHPGLLDWLARLLRDGSSFKELHRMMVTSRTYRQVSRGPSTAFQRNRLADPENLLFSRMSRRRLTGEAIRDSILHASNRLNLKPGGPGFRPHLAAEVRSTLLKNQWNPTSEETEHSRRSIYLFVRRNLRYPMFDVFDRPDTNASCGRRLVSTTAPQALTLFNSEFSRENAEQLAAILRASGKAPAEAVKEAYLRVFCRYPTANEQATAQEFLRMHSPVIGLDNAWADFCLALLNGNEAIYVD